MKQHEAVIRTIDRLGGIATLGQLYREVLGLPGCKWGTKTPNESIRRIVQTRREIYRIKPGLYGLTSKRQDIEAKGIIAVTPANRGSKEVIESNHTYYQGVLLLVGKLRKYDTFAPQQDKNKAFLGKTLADSRTLDKIPPFSYAPIVRRSQNIDVIWFNDRRMPAAFFEVEFSTNIQNSLVKFTDLQDFYAMMIIVSDRHRRAEYEARLSSAAFKDICGRVKLLNFDSLLKQYEGLMAAASAGVVL